LRFSGLRVEGMVSLVGLPTRDTRKPYTRILASRSLRHLSLANVPLPDAAAEVLRDRDRGTEGQREAERQRQRDRETERQRQRDKARETERPPLLSEEGTA